MRPRLCKLEVEMDRVREGGWGKEKHGGMRRQARKEEKTCLRCQQPRFLPELGRKEMRSSYLYSRLQGTGANSRISLRDVCRTKGYLFVFVATAVALLQFWFGLVWFVSSLFLFCFVLFCFVVKTLDGHNDSVVCLVLLLSPREKIKYRNRRRAKAKPKSRRKTARFRKVLMRLLWRKSYPLQLIQCYKECVKL